MENLAVWFEIPVIDMERAAKFYAEVLRIEIQVQDMHGTLYGFFPMKDYGNSGALVKNPDYQPSATGVIIYLNGGEDLSKVLDRVEPEGGKIIVPKTIISEEIGYYGLFSDTEGNRLGLYSTK
jgi:predicted enzyme related to lactoylglutathione lyase